MKQYKQLFQIIQKITENMGTELSRSDTQVYKLTVRKGPLSVVIEVNHEISFHWKSLHNTGGTI